MNYVAFGGILWFACCGNCEYGWFRRKAWLGVDFYLSESPPLLPENAEQGRTSQEGIFSVLMGVIGFFVVPSTPREVISLSPKQKEYVVCCISFMW